MSDAIDGGIDTANDEEEANKVYSQICDEIGVDQNDEFEVGKGKIVVNSGQ